MENGREGFEIFDRVMVECRARLDVVDHRPGLADLAEIRLWAWLEAGSPAGTDDRLGEVIDAVNRLEVPSRLHYLAEALGKTAAAALPSYSRHLAQAGVRAVPVSLAPAGEVAHLLTLGRPRVEREGEEWPMALWPMWWGRLWAMVLAAFLERRAVGREEVMRLAEEAEDAPRENLDALVHGANVLLFGGSRPGGGLHVRGERVELAWGGIASDVREVIEGLETRVTRDEALDRVAGDYLPGFDDPATLRIRERVRRLVGEGLEARLAEPETIPLETLVHWVDGCGRVSGMVPRLVELIRMRNRQEPAALLPASP
jgi:hypothetical protein